MIVIIAGSKQQAIGFMVSCGLDRHQGHIVNTFMDLVGSHHSEYFLVGTYKQRPDWEEIKRYLQEALNCAGVHTYAPVSVEEL